MDPRSKNGPGTDRHASLAEEFRTQEACLRTGVPAVRVGIVPETALSYGIGVAATARYLDRARAEGVAVVRRSTGGSGLLHLRGDLYWAVVLPREDPRVGRDFVRAFDRLGEGTVRGLGSVGVRAEWGPAPALAEAYCPLSSRGRVLCAAGRILGGAAQHATATALLHHGSLSWRVDRAMVDRLFELEADGPSRHLAGVSELSPARTAQDVARALEAANRAHFRL